MKMLLLLLALLPLFACTTKATPPQVDDQAVLALGLKNGVLVEPLLVSSGQPTEAQFSRLGELGYRTVIQLRPASEEGSGWEEAKARELGLNFVRIPVSGAADLTEANARKLDAALRARGSGGALVACASGNRVGGLLALKAHFCDGLPAAQALEFGKKAGLVKAEADVRTALGLPTGR